MRKKKRGLVIRENRQQKNNKAAIEMSFQFIFSLILIGVVIFVGFFGIKMFLEQVEKNKFQEFPEQVSSAASSISNDGGRVNVDINLNSAIKYVCFANISTSSSCKQGKVTPSDFQLNSFCVYALSYREIDKNYNMFYFPFEAATKYTSPAQKVYCGTEARPKACLNITNPVCIPLINGRGKMILDKQDESSLINVIASVAD